MKTYKDLFICEICKYQTPKEFEGSEPNTCCACMPLDNEKTHTLGHKWYELKQLPNEYVISPETAQNEPKSKGVEINVKELVKKIKVFITKHSELHIAPHGDFEVIISLNKLNNFLKELEEGENNG